MNRLPDKPDTTPISIFNPSLEEFVFIYDKQVYTLPAYGIETYPKYIADRMASSLADKIIGQRGVLKNHTLDKKNILTEIYVK